ncbi:MAG: Tad domain-containing protein [Candidatus Omnitrophica bacterium]|nr:Tad domain-containing protein [Candidatus Omnitrophota bacterium]
MFKKTDKNTGTIIVLFVVLITIMMFMIAFAVDVGYVYTTKSELQHAADSAAMAAMWELKDKTDPNLEPNAKARALEYGAYNPAAEVDSLTVDQADVHIGFMDDPFNIYKELDPNGMEMNTVEVFVNRSQTLNGPLALFMGGITGTKQVQLQAKARAFITDRIIGFDSAPGWEEVESTDNWLESYDGNYYAPTDERDPVLWPFTISATFWVKWFNGYTKYAEDRTNNPNYVEVDMNKDGEFERYYFEDNYAYMGIINEDSTVDEGKSDEKYGVIKKFIPEFNMYPDSSDKTPGNFGTIDIGTTDNSTDDLMFQINYGISDADIALARAQYDQDFELDDDEPILFDIDLDGDMEQVLSQKINADTGTSMGIQNPIHNNNNQYPRDMIGEDVIVTLFDDASLGEVGPGENTYYNIIGFATVKIMDLVIGGQDGSHLVVQPVGYSITDGSSGSTGEGENNESGTTGFDVSEYAIIGFDGPEVINSSMFVFGLTR